MQHIRFGFVLVLGLAALLAAPADRAQAPAEEVRIQTLHVAGPVYMLVGQGGNIGVSAGEDGVLIVDDQFAPLAEKIKAALKKLGSDKPTFILNTHWHGDHTGGNPVFGRDGHIIAHHNVRRRLSTRQEIFGRTVEPLPKEGLPVLTFGEDLSIHFNGEEIQAVHYPRGHTDGDSVIYFTGSNVVHMGDDFFSGRFPFVDLDSGGSVQGLIANIRTILERLPEDVKIIPGHGPLSTKDDLRAYLKMLEETSNHVWSQVRAGKSLEDIQSAGLPEAYASWGSGFISTERWIEILVRSAGGGE